MPTATEIATAIALLGGGGAVGRATAGLGRPVVRTVAASPMGRAVILGNMANQIAKMAEEAYLEEQGIDPGLAFEGSRTLGAPLLPLQREQMVALDILKPKAAKKRAISKANKAVKHAMSLLKAGTKRSTGADKGKLPKAAFKIAVKAAGLANPGTPSKIKAGKSITKNLARKLKKWWK